jgi:regulator of sigma E protease
MSEFLGSAWWLLVTLGILVTFHEFGHYWVARRCGVRVLRFSVGFGKPLWSRIGRDGVEYAIGAIPLGGYVKFLDSREAENPELVAHQPGEYNAASVWRRMAIAVAGPLFNFMFAVLAFWVMFVVGLPDSKPIIAPPTALAAQSGFQTGDRLTGIAGESVDSWSNAVMGIAEATMLHRDVAIGVVDAKGQARERMLPLSRLPADTLDSEKAFEAIGLKLQAPPAVVGAVEATTPAGQAGMKAGDRIARINDIAIGNWEDLTRVIGEQAARNPHLHVVVSRGNDAVPLDLTAIRSDDAKPRWVIGISGGERELDAIEHYGPLQAIPAAFAETWKKSRDTVAMIGSMLTGHASTKNLSSVITIAQVANASAQRGLAWFLSFLGVISLSLGILNLLPIPILDGGHLLYYTIELIKGSPLSERALIAGQYVGLALLVTLMSLAFYNDIVRSVAS